MREHDGSIKAGGHVAQDVTVEGNLGISSSGEQTGKIRESCGSNQHLS